MDKNTIPKTLEEAFEVLKLWKGLNSFKELSHKDVSGLHHTVGRYIRNEWGLWSSEETPLKKYFKELGITHPDDISDIILQSFYRHINGLDIELEEQIKGILNYWKEHNNVFEKSEGK